MIKVFRIFGWIIASFIILVVLLIGYARSDFNKSYRKQEINDLVSDIKSAKTIPKGYKKLYYQKKSVCNTTGYIGNNLFGENDVSCPCLQIARMNLIPSNGPRIFSNPYILSWKLEKTSSQTECLNYLMKNLDFLNGCIGAEEASRFYLKNEFTDLTDDQYLVLIEMMQNPYSFIQKQNNN